MRQLKDFFKDMLDQLWTVVALFIGYIVLEGSAKTVTGYLIIGTTVFWAATHFIRKNED